MPDDTGSASLRGTAGPTPNSLTESPRDSATREQRGLREPPGQPADVHIFQYGRGDVSRRGVGRRVAAGRFRCDHSEATQSPHPGTDGHHRRAVRRRSGPAGRGRRRPRSSRAGGRRRLDPAGRVRSGRGRPGQSAGQRRRGRSRGTTVGGVDLARRRRARCRLHPLGVPARRQSDRDPRVHQLRALLRPAAVDGGHPTRAARGLVAYVGSGGSGGRTPARARGRAAGHRLAGPLPDRLLATARLARRPRRPSGDRVRRTGRSDPPGRPDPGPADRARARTSTGPGPGSAATGTPCSPSAPATS